jgi:hypothetical protein
MDYVKAITNQNKNLKTDVIIKSLNEHFQKLIKFRKTKHASLCKYFIIPYIYYRLVLYYIFVGIHNTEYLKLLVFIGATQAFPRRNKYPCNPLVVIK